MTDIEKLTKEIIKFRNKRNWKQFHNPKDLALSMMLEAGEVVEHFQWQNEAEMREYVKHHREHIGDEIADVLKYLLILSHDLKIDVKKAVLRKMAKDDLKYPVSKARGSHLKYDKYV